MTAQGITRLAAAVLLSTVLVHCAAAAPPVGVARAEEQEQEGWKTVAHYDSPALAEISGLAPSGLRAGVLWGHNDSGGDAALHALDLAGNALGSVRVLGVANRDWEDLSAFHDGGIPHLLIADTGDNGLKRTSVQLHAVAEPAAKPDGSYAGLAVRPVWTLTARYEDGPQDCEAVAVVPGENRVLLLNKHGKISVVYSVAYGPAAAQGTVVARKLVILPEVSNAAGNVVAFFKAGVLGTRATGMDIAPNGRLAVVLTYTDIRIFARREGQAWAEALVQIPRVIALPAIYQPEALCFSRDSKLLYVSSEESPTPLVRYRLSP